jgi:hypothetical protein
MECYKARLIAKGHAQNDGTDNNETFSLIAKMTSICTVLGIVALEDSEVHQMDFKTTLLPLKVDMPCKNWTWHKIMMIAFWRDWRHLEGYVSRGEESLVCRLFKTLYGLEQSPRTWY